MHSPIDWLLEGPAYIRYRARVDLLGLPEDDALVARDRAVMLGDPILQSILTELLGWPGQIVNSHKSAGQPFHKLTFLADLGLVATDPHMDVIVDRIMALRSTEGPFGLRMNIGKTYGGSGEDVLGWALCDAPLILYALLKLGLDGNPGVRAAGEHLISLNRTAANSNPLGWPCAVSSTLGSWRGPGRKDDPCPFANLAMLKALSLVPEWRDSPPARAGAQTLLSLWADSQTRHPYIFYMGTDFRKLKAPFIWYDLLHVLDVLTRFPWLQGEPRLREMLDLLESKAGDGGRFTAESVWQAWSAWEFGQKKLPSRWLTLLAHRILDRVNGSAHHWDAACSRGGR
jgi:hypothetical protein